jgi:hypothetical protein
MKQAGGRVLLRLANIDQWTSHTWIICQVDDPDGVRTEFQSGGLSRLTATLQGKHKRSLVASYPFDEWDLPLKDGAYGVMWLGRNYASSREGEKVLAQDVFHVHDGEMSG